MGSNNLLDEGNPSHGWLMANTLWNIAGAVGPAAAGLLTIPYLVRSLGTERFGFLTLAWALVGYFGLLEFGFGRATTKLTTEALGNQDAREVRQLLWCSFWVILAVSVLCTTVLVLVSGPLTHTLLHPSPASRDETLHALQVLLCAIPFATSSMTVKGYLEAHRKFLAVNAVRTFAGIASFVFPLLAAQVLHNLVAVSTSIVVARAASLLAYFLCVFAGDVRMLRPSRPNRATLAKLLRFGGWLTVSNAISPLMTYMDRLVLSALISLQATAYYATPYEVVSRLMILPNAVAVALFPSLVSLRRSTPEGIKRAYNLGLAFSFTTTTTLAIAAGLFAPELLELWLGPDFARNSSPSGRVLCMSLAVNSLSLIVSTMIQAAGRPDVTAKCHLLELPLYMLAVVVFTRSYGIVGCALAGLFRLLVDAVLLIWFSRRIKAPLPRRWVYGLALTGTAAMLVFSSSMSAALRAVAVCGTVATGCVFLRRESSGTQLSCRSTAE